MIRVEELPACNVGCRVSLAFRNGLKCFLSFIHRNLGLPSFCFLKKKHSHPEMALYAACKICLKWQKGGFYVSLSWNKDQIWIRLRLNIWPRGCLVYGLALDFLEKNPIKMPEKLILVWIFSSRVWVKFRFLRRSIKFCTIIL